MKAASEGEEVAQTSREEYMRTTNRLLQTMRMREVYLGLFLMFLGWRHIEANSAVKALDVTMDHEGETGHSNLTSGETQNFRHEVATPAVITEESPVALVNTSREDEVRHSTPLPMKESPGLQTLSVTREKNSSTATNSSGGINDSGIPNAKAAALSNNTGIPAQSQPRKGPLQSEGPRSPKGAPASRSSRQSDNGKTPSFETTRGK